MKFRLQRFFERLSSFKLKVNSTCGKNILGRKPIKGINIVEIVTEYLVVTSWHAQLRQYRQRRNDDSIIECTVNARARQTEFSPAWRQSVYQVDTIGYDIQVGGNQRYRDLIKDHRKAIINAARYIDFGRSDALGQCNVLIRQPWREERRYYACAYLRRKLFARGGKRINVAAQLLWSAFYSERVRCFSNNDIASPSVVQQRKLLS